MEGSRGAVSEKARLIENARKLVPVLRARAEATNQARRIPQETIDDYWNTNLFGILRPKRYGGLELRFDDFLEVASEVGRGTTFELRLPLVTRLRESPVLDGRA